MVLYKVGPYKIVLGGLSSVSISVITLLGNYTLMRTPFITEEAQFVIISVLWWIYDEKRFIIESASHLNFRAKSKNIVIEVVWSVMKIDYHRTVLACVVGATMLVGASIGDAFHVYML